MNSIYSKTTSRCTFTGPLWLVMLNPMSGLLRRAVFMRNNCKNTINLRQLSNESSQHFLVYHHLKFRLHYPRLALGIGVPCLLITGYMSEKTQEEYAESEAEVSRKVPENFVTNLYMGKIGKAIPWICNFSAIVMAGLSVILTRTAVKKLLLSTDRTQVSLVTYRMFGGETVRTFPRTSIQFIYPNKVKINNSWRQFYLSEDGVITNKALYNHALQTFRFG